MQRVQREPPVRLDLQVDPLAHPAQLDRQAHKELKVLRVRLGRLEQRDLLVQPVCKDRLAKQAKPVLLGKLGQLARKVRLVRLV